MLPCCPSEQQEHQAAVYSSGSRAASLPFGYGLFRESIALVGSQTYKLKKFFKRMNFRLWSTQRFPYIHKAYNKYKRKN